MPKTAIVILSYNLLSMTRDCIESIRETVPESACEIIVVDNASVDGSAEWLKKQKDIKVLRNAENKGFPAGCNQGIRLAEADSDIFLLNNDTVLTDNALFWLRMGLYEDGEVGSVGSVSNHVSNFQEVVEDGKSRREYLEFAKQVNIPGVKPYSNKLHLVGFALLLKRTVLNQIGLLDERFSPGNWEDNDICLRVILAGYRNVLCKNSFIIHWGSKSFGKERHKYGGILEINQGKFFEKWSAIQLSADSYLNIRMELLPIMEKECGISDGNIMVVGTGCGGFMSCLQETFPDAHVYGMEPHMYMAQIADRIADTVYVDLDKWKGDQLADTFDVIVINDVLEGSGNPGAVLKELAKMLKRDGKLVISFRNSQYYSRISRPDENRGLFSHDQASRMLSEAKLTENVWQYTTIGVSEELDQVIQKLHAQYPTVTRDALLAHQWINVVEKQRTDIRFDDMMAVCIPTCGHPEVVEDVLKHCAEIYYRYGLDVYYYDSSRDEETKKVIESYQKRGYDNLHYISIDPEMPLGIKFEHVLMMDGISKEYTYMWYLRERGWCGERTLRLMRRAMEELHDLLFIDAGHPDSCQELTVCRNANEFYHRCGEYATSMDTTIYNVKTILKDNFNIKEFHERHGEYRGAFLHFLIIFEQLAKRTEPNICLLSGINAGLINSQKGQSAWHERRINTWGKYWLQANEALPDCYTDREKVIKHATALPWILGDLNLLVDLHNKGILTPEYFEKIKEFWEKISDIPLETIRRIAYGEYRII